VAEKARVDVVMTVGLVTETVEVTGENMAQVETSSSSLSGTVSSSQITQLQLNGRNFVQLATIVPGVSNQTGQDEAQVGVNGSVHFSMNGGRTEYNNWELDGSDNMDNGSNGTLNVYPSIEAIAEFKVLTSNYGAQYGRNGSGTVEVETRSGTNKFHGSVYYFGCHDAMNARNFFEDKTSETPKFKKHDFGFTVGGPVFIPKIFNEKKEKTFFFWSEEWRKDLVPGPLRALPTYPMSIATISPALGPVPTSISVTC
jgi:outer membrane receptor protein involved in Fe transport